MGPKFICIHGHFYQPPREDPWLEEIEFQKSALPFHDWNERITAECYFPNAYARRIDGKGQIIKIVNNYEKISFNFGPTLLLWLRKHKLEVLHKIIEADQKSCLAYHGHGNAIAQVYNHIIMPLANYRDKVTQTKWGIAAFKYFFGRYPEGMWLAETAVDNETLKVLAQHKIKFTILAPRQAAAIRRIGEKEWQEVDETNLDITMPYRCYLNREHYIDIFFYHGALSQGIAFGGLVQNGDHLAHHLEQTFGENESSQILSVATDGETFGHHWKFAEMALAYVIDYFSEHPQISFINFGAYLARFSPMYEVKIKENTSWSCVHGIDRWRDDCGCCTGAHPGWNQKWRKPLRNSLNWLRDQIDILFEKEGKRFFKDPWKARDDYIDIVLDPRPKTKDNFLGHHTLTSLNENQRIDALKLLEMQYYGQLMFTSCGWFFDDISGLEARQNLRYASRVIQLAKDFGLELESEFVKRIKEAKSNMAKYGDGAQIYNTLVKPKLYDLKRLAVHFSFSHLFEEPPCDNTFYTARIKLKERRSEEASGNLLLFDHMEISHIRTEEKQELITIVLFLGALDLLGTALPVNQKEFGKILFSLFKNLSFYEVKDKIIQNSPYYGIHDVFFDNRRQLATLLVEEKLQALNNAYLEFYQENKSLMFALKELHIPLPETFIGIARTVLENILYEEYRKELEGQPNQLRRAIKETEELGINIDTTRLSKLLGEFIKDKLHRFLETFDLNHIKKINSALSLCGQLCQKLDLWSIQNLFWDLLPYIKGQYKDEIPSEILILAQMLNFGLED